ncbi:MAG: glycerol-3-phosphate dehydrogenase/oxidase [Xanthomonadales bacterium]|nr:glycerol-3-phosphate dehydrogenase/oxidase [Xanthomonadales bacterium]
MRASFDALDRRSFDLAIVGGGATGAFVAWDASLRGLSVALLEKEDFCSATSFANSRLIHGGLRYLRQGQFGVVRASLAERRYWLSAAPHLVRPLPFLIPVANLRRRLTYRFGLTLYGWLGGRSDLPPDRALDPAEIQRNRPLLAPLAGAGALLYHDAQMAYPERLVLAALQGAVERGAQVMNYCRAEAISRSGKTGYALEFLDRDSGRNGHLLADKVINATGPWADQLELPGRKLGLKLVRSSGIHLVTRALAGPEALAIEHAGRHFFVIPWEGHSLIGTTDLPFDGDPDDYRVESSSVDTLLDRVNDALPGISLSRADVLYAYGGMRPLLEHADGGGTYRASRRSEILEHDRGLFSAVGGKWTTSRRLAEKAVDRCCNVRGTSRHVPLPGADPLPGSVPEALPHLPAGTAAHLLKLYGNRARLLVNADESPELLKACRPLIRAQARYAAQYEGARHLSDVLFRRTGVGYFDRVPDSTLQALAEAMGPVLGWSRETIDAEIAHIVSHYAGAVP